MIQRADAAAKGSAVTRVLETKGVNFGAITAFSNGEVDTSAVEGCDPDLRIRPFHQKGMASSIRIFARGALKAALWGQDRKPGEYDMMDVLGL